MKLTITNLNTKLESVGLELVRDRYTKKVSCYISTLSETKEQLYGMNIINQELNKSQKLSSITWLSYFN